MAKGQAKAVNDAANTERQYLQTRRQDDTDRFRQGYDQERTQGQQDYKGIFGRYNDIYNQAGPENNPATSYFRQFAQGGGLDPRLQAGQERNIGQYEDFANLKDPSGQYYSDLIKSGGFTPQDIQNIRSRATATIPGFFQATRDKMEQAQRASGGSNVGYDSQLKSVARDQARAGADASLGAELGISGQVRSGRMAGAQGAASNFLAGMGGATGTRGNLMDMQQRGKLAGAQGLSSVFGQSNQTRLAAAGGQAGLYGTTPGRESEQLRAYLQAQGLGDDDIARILAMQSQRNPNKSFMDKANEGLDFAGRLAGLAAPFFGGGAAGAMSGGPEIGKGFHDYIPFQEPG